jgi:hypothetical protein
MTFWAAATRRVPRKTRRVVSWELHLLTVEQYRARTEWSKRFKVDPNVLRKFDEKAKDLVAAQDRAAVAEENLAWANAQLAFNEERFAEERRLDALWVAALQKLIVSANRRLTTYGLPAEAALDIHDRQKMIERSK